LRRFAGVSEAKAERESAILVPLAGDRRWGVERFFPIATIAKGTNMEKISNSRKMRLRSHKQRSKPTKI